MKCTFEHASLKRKTTVDKNFIHVPDNPCKIDKQLLNKLYELFALNSLHFFSSNVRSKEQVLGIMLYFEYNYIGSILVR